MGHEGGPRELFTASEVARFCQVDLKTIHNWCERGEIRHFRTPGRHLRFRRVDVIDFLRKYGYPVPDAVRAGRARVLVIDDDATALAATKRQLAKKLEISAQQDAIDAVLALGAEPADAVVLEARLAGVDVVRLVTRLRASPRTRHMRVVVYSSHDDLRKKLLDAGATSFVVKPDLARLRETLEAMLGTER